jgi:hypothetical protein
MASVTLTHSSINSGNPVEIKCNVVSISGKRNTEKAPNANADGPVEIQTQGYENLVYNITGIRYTGAAGTLTWDDVLTLYKEGYDGTNYATLNITYGESTTLKGLEGSANIKVILETPNLSISAEDSRNAYLPMGTLKFSETA